MQKKGRWRIHIRELFKKGNLDSNILLHVQWNLKCFWLKQNCCKEYWCFAGTSCFHLQDDTAKCHNLKDLKTGHQICSFIHSIGMCRIWRFLAILRNFFHSSLLCTFSCHPSPPTILPSSDMIAQYYWWHPQTQNASAQYAQIFAVNFNFWFQFSKLHNICNTHSAHHVSMSLNVFTMKCNWTCMGDWPNSAEWRSSWSLFSAR